MKCERPTGVQIYRYTEQLFGLGTTTYEIRTEGQWVPICTPSEKSWAWDEKTKAYSATKCVPGDKAITKKELSRLGNLPWQTVTTETVDFVTLSRRHLITGPADFTQCKPFSRG